MAVFSWDSVRCLFFGDDACRSGLRLGSCASCWRSPVRSQFASLVTDNQEEIASVACRRVFFEKGSTNTSTLSLSAFRKTFGVPRQRPLQSSVEARRWLRVCSLCQNRIFFAIVLRSAALFLNRVEVALVVRQNLFVQHQDPMWDATTAHHEKIQSLSWYVERMSVAQWEWVVLYDLTVASFGTALMCYGARCFGSPGVERVCCRVFT